MSDPELLGAANGSQGDFGADHPPVKAEPLADSMLVMSKVLDSLVDKVSRWEVPEPVVFSLGSERTLESFFSEFETFVTSRYGTDKSYWSPRLDAFLSEPLKSLCIGMRSMGADYVSLKSSLIASYGSKVHTKARSDFILDFEKCLYSPEEGIPGLVCRLRTLGERACKGLEPKIIEGLVKQQCLKVLPEYLRKPLQFQNLTNPDLTLNELIRIGTALQRTETPLVNIDAIAGQASSGLESSVERLTPAPAPHRNRVGTCSYCRRPGHVRENCYRLGKACFNCGKRAHFRAQCPSLSAAVVQQRGASGETPTSSSDSGVSVGPVCPFCWVQGHMMAGCRDFELFMEGMVRRVSNTN